ncbi:MAG: hypothetical protein [Caudoviricetes sp.]|nr:MAG: hypothetical protein [Caudoviricetes sp.]
MNILQKQKLISLSTDLQTACIAYGRAVANATDPDNDVWVRKMSEKWKEAEDAFREYIVML